MNEEEAIRELRKRVEETAGLKPMKSKDFEQLVIAIYGRTGTLLSPTTLKRIWGYLKEATATRRSTLDILARFCGWLTYSDFVARESPKVDSGFVGVKMINVDRDLKKGDMLTLMWHPSRVCEVRYEGDGQWTVIRSEGTRMEPGDTFRCRLIMSGEPLYVSDFVHNGIPSGAYVCGRRNGIRFKGDTTSDPI